MNKAKLTRAESDHVLDRWDAESARVDEDGRLLVWTYAERGDGGPVPWEQFVGYAEDVRRESAGV